MLQIFLPAQWGVLDVLSSLLWWNGFIFQVVVVRCTGSVSCVCMVSKNAAALFCKVEECERTLLRRSGVYFYTFSSLRPATNTIGRNVDRRKVKLKSCRRGCVCGTGFSVFHRRATVEFQCMGLRPLAIGIERSIKLYVDEDWRMEKILYCIVCGMQSSPPLKRLTFAPHKRIWYKWLLKYLT